MQRKPLMLGGAAVAVIVIVLLAFVLNRGDDGDKPSAVATDPAAATVATPSPTDSVSSEAPTTSAPTMSATAPAPAKTAKTSAPAPGTAVGPPALASFARFAHPPTANGGPGSTSGTNQFLFPVDQIQPISSTIRVHIEGMRVSPTCSAPSSADASCKAPWSTNVHNATVKYYLTVEPADTEQYSTYTSPIYSVYIP